MTPEYYNIDFVGFNRGFVTGHHDDKEFEVELTENQLRMVQAFMGEQGMQLQEFLKGLVF